jgi:CRP-like cAMP-binding protein
VTTTRAKKSEADLLTDRLAALSLFVGVPRDGIRALVGQGRLRRCARGERVLAEGDESRSFFIQLTGTTGVFLTDPSGEADLLAKLFVAPACFGEIEVLTGIPHLEYVEVFTPAEIFVAPAAAYTALLRSSPEASWGLLRDLAKRMCISVYNAKAIAFHAVEERIAALLLSFAEAFGEVQADGSIVVQFKLTNHMIARCVGAGVRSVERTLAQWTEEGVVRRDGRSFRFSSRDALVARTDPERLLVYSRLEAEVPPHRAAPPPSPRRG